MVVSLGVVPPQRSWRLRGGLSSGRALGEAALRRPGPHGQEQIQLIHRRCCCAKGEEQADVGSSLSSFEATDPALTTLVDVLTRVVNFFGKEEVNAEAAAKAPAAPLTEAELLQGLRSDFEEREYLWTGKITPGLYMADCVFTDPTLSFKGLGTFLKNLENLDPIIKALIREDRKVELRSIKLERENLCVIAKWRMVGTLKVPWKPRLDLCGQTTFFYDEEQKRVKRYYEQWEESVGDAFKQLIFPK